MSIPIPTKIERLYKEVARLDKGLSHYDCARRLEEAMEIIYAYDRVLGALGVIGGGYCFCSKNRDPDRADHQPECAEALALLEE